MQTKLTKLILLSSALLMTGCGKNNESSQSNQESKEIEPSKFVEVSLTDNELSSLNRSIQGNVFSCKTIYSKIEYEENYDGFYPESMEPLFEIDEYSFYQNFYTLTETETEYGNNFIKTEETVFDVYGSSRGSYGDYYSENEDLLVLADVNADGTPATTNMMNILDFSRETHIKNGDLGNYIVNDEVTDFASLENCETAFNDYVNKNIADNSEAFSLFEEIKLMGELKCYESKSELKILGTVSMFDYDEYFDIDIPNKTEAIAEFLFEKTENDGYRLIDEKAEIKFMPFFDVLGNKFDNDNAPVIGHQSFEYKITYGERTNVEVPEIPSEPMFEYTNYVITVFDDSLTYCDWEYLQFVPLYEEENVILFKTFDLDPFYSYSIADYKSIDEKQGSKFADKIVENQFITVDSSAEDNDYFRTNLEFSEPFMVKIELEQDKVTIKSVTITPVLD